MSVSTVLPTTEGKTPDKSPVRLPSSQYSKSQRVLSCILCQQRKVRCDRKHPCSNCIKSRAQCVPATQIQRQRRRRFPERELLERLRKYEDLLHQNNIKFEPLHNESASKKEPGSGDGGYDSEDELFKAAGKDSSSPSTSVKSDRVYDSQHILDSINQQFRQPDDIDDSSDDDLRQIDVKQAWAELYSLENHDHLLFGSLKTAVDISTLHPEPIQIFRLWQLYLENVDPLLKVTHTPSLQGRMIEAAGNVSNIKPPLEALMFSIYCMSVESLGVDDCQNMFGSSKPDLLRIYQFGCQQALLNCGFLQSDDRECLTALYFYLVSVRTNTFPQSLSSMLGVAIRVAQRMGIHRESYLAKCTPLEAELRRRLWWALVLFDTRIGELADSKTAILNPTWDCTIPLNVNDSELEMKNPPQVRGKSTEAIFMIVRSEMGDFTRHARSDIEFSSTTPKNVSKDGQHSSVLDCRELDSLEKMIGDKYLKFCDPETPLHFFTIWMTRAHLAKCRLLEYHSKFTSSSIQQPEALRGTAMSYAISMLECDIQLASSPLTKGFQWLVNLYFPFIAYVQILQNLKRRPTSDRAEEAWEVMSNHYQARLWRAQKTDSPFRGPFFKMFTKIILPAWAAREAILKQSGEPLVTPKIVSSVRHKLTQMGENAQNLGTEQRNGAPNLGKDGRSISAPMSFGNDNLLYGMEGQGGNAEIGSWASSDIPGLASVDFDVNQLDWSAMDWDMLNAPYGRDW